MPSAGHTELTTDSWARLLEFLAPSEREAGQCYEVMRDRIVQFFRWRGALEPEALADETFNRVARRLTEGGVPDTSVPERYVLGVARRLLLEHGRTEQRRRRAHDDAAEVLYTASTAQERERYAMALERCLQRHASPDLELFMRYHQAGRGRDRIAARAEMARAEGIQLGVLRTRMHRVRRVLLACIERCIDDGQPMETSR